MLFVFFNFMYNYKILNFKGFNKFLIISNKMYYNKYKDEIMTLYLLDYYKLDNQNFNSLRRKLSELKINFKNCENKPDLKPCVLDLRNQDIIK